MAGYRIKPPHKPVLPTVFKEWVEQASGPWESRNFGSQAEFTYPLFLKEIGLEKPGTNPENPETYITPKEYASLMKGTAIPDREAAKALAELADKQGLISSDLFMKLYEKHAKFLPKEEEEYGRKKMNTNHPTSDLTVLEFPEEAVEQIKQLVARAKTPEKSDGVAIEGRPSTPPDKGTER